MASGNDEASSDKASWFPEGADEATIKKRFRELAATLHPDRVDGDSIDAVAQFQELTEEYTQLLGKCRTADQREALRIGWMSVGGLYAATAVALGAPVVAETAAIAVGAIATLSLAAEYLTKGDKDGRLLEAGGAPDEESRGLTEEEAAAAELEAARRRMEELRNMYRQDRASAFADAEESSSTRSGVAAIPPSPATPSPLDTPPDVGPDSAPDTAPDTAPVPSTRRLAARAQRLERRSSPPPPSALAHAASSAQAGALMPAALAAWGCDETLWRQVESRRLKKELRRLLRQGDEARGRKRIAQLRQLIDESRDSREPSDPS